MIKVYGTSDDLVEIEGDVTEEFNHYRGPLVLGFSDGTALRIEYMDSGVWRITPVSAGPGVVVVQALEDDDDDYSDVATIDAEVRWVVAGPHVATAS